MSEKLHMNKAGTKMKVTYYQSNGDSQRTVQTEVKGESVPSLRMPTICRLPPSEWGQGWDNYQDINMAGENIIKEKYRTNLPKWII